MGKHCTIMVQYSISSNLTLDEHGHVHKHVVQLSNTVLELHNVLVTRLDIGERLFGRLRVHDNLYVLAMTKFAVSSGSNVVHVVGRISYSD